MSICVTTPNVKTLICSGCRADERGAGRRTFTQDRYGALSHRQGEEAERDLRSEIRIVPTRQRAAWQDLRDEIAERIRAAMVEREAASEASRTQIASG